MNKISVVLMVNNRKEFYKEALEEAGKAFKSDKVTDIIREGTIQNQLYLNSLGYYKKIPLYDMFWLMGRPVIQKKAKKFFSEGE